MVEVFKTNVEYQDHANKLLEQIHKAFPGYKANFDLDDCDKILRVACAREYVDVSSMINLLKKHGYAAEVLDDDQPASVVEWAKELSFHSLRQR